MRGDLRAHDHRPAAHHPAHGGVGLPAALGQQPVERSGEGLGVAVVGVGAAALLGGEPAGAPGGAGPGTFSPARPDAGRLELVEGLRPLVAQAYASVAESGAGTVTGPAELAYRSSLDGDGEGGAGAAATVPDRAGLAARMLQSLSDVRRQELDRGVSLVGPHRDELVLTLGPLPAKGYASHGESWSFALALRLAAYDLLRGDTDDGGEPVLVLDDVFAELDDQRRARLATLVAGAEQVLVTAAVPGDVPGELRGARVDVLGAEVRRVA